MYREHIACLGSLLHFVPALELPQQPNAKQGWGTANTASLPVQSTPVHSPEQLPQEGMWDA